MHGNEAVQERGTFGVEGFRRTLAGVAALVTEFTNRPRVTYGGRGFGARGLRVDGKIFAMLDSKADS